MSAFTQGPWTVPTDAPFIVRVGQRGESFVAPGYEDSEQRANARLIAAAPEMYEALACLEPALKGPMPAGIMFQAAELIMHALAKARGETP